MAKHLEDIGKDAKDLLTESFPIDGSAKITTQTKCLGFVQKVGLLRSLKREKTGVREVVTAVFEPKYELKDPKVEISSKVSTANDFTVGTTVRDLIGSGSKFEINATTSDKDGFNGVAAASYKNDTVAIKGKVTYPFTPKKPIKITSEAVYHHSGFGTNLGVGVDVSLEENIARIFTEGVLSHSSKDAQYKGSVRYDVYDATLLYGLSFFQKISDRNSWAFDISAEDNLSKSTFTAGTEYKVDELTTVKGKWKLVKNNDKLDYRLGASLKQKVSHYVTLTVGSDLNPRSFLGSADGEPHSFGLEIKFQD
jgi:hypothetical protein